MNETPVVSVRVALNATAAKTAAARRAPGDWWTWLAKIRRCVRGQHWRWPPETQLKAHCKGRWPTHSQTIDAVIEKFCSAVDGVRTNPKHGARTVPHPCWLRQYFPIFKGQAQNDDGRHLLLPLGRGRKSRRVHLPKIPTGRTRQTGLGFKPIYLTMTREISESPLLAASLDIGVIHLGVVSDGEHALVILGRGAGLIVERVTPNVLHHAAKQTVAFCLAHATTVLYPGDLGTLSHKELGRRPRRTNQKIEAMEFGRLETSLEYKLRRDGLQSVKTGEAVRSHRVQLKSMVGRTCRRRACDLPALGPSWRFSRTPGRWPHGDGAGALNTRNQGHAEAIGPGVIVPQPTTYRPRVPLEGTSRRSCGTTLPRLLVG